MIVLQMKSIGPTVPTSRLAPQPAASPADGHQTKSGDPGSEPAHGQAPEASSDPILCRHCGRTASNGISCEGSCVADSLY